MDETIRKGREWLESVLVEYRDGLITEQEKNDKIFDILYQVLYPEQFEQFEEV